MKKALSILQLAVLLLGLVGFAHAGPLDGKSPAYFVDRYGPAKSNQIESRFPFNDPRFGSFNIKGPFSVREYRQGDLRVQAVFFHPALRLAAVRIQLNRQWTDEQVDAALAAYGGEWELIRNNRGLPWWEAPDGASARKVLNWIDFYSKEVRDAVRRAAEEDEAKNKAVPKF